MREQLATSDFNDLMRKLSTSHSAPCPFTSMGFLSVTLGNHNFRDHNRCQDEIEREERTAHPRRTKGKKWQKRKKEMKIPKTNIENSRQIVTPYSSKTRSAATYAFFTVASLNHERISKARSWCPGKLQYNGSNTRSAIPRSEDSVFPRIW